MKKFFLLAGLSLCLSGCATLFTGTRQAITFAGKEGVAIYKNGIKIGEIGKSGSVTTKVKKSLSSPTLIAKKTGYKDTPLIMQTQLNGVACINLLNPLAWAIDLGTGAACKYENNYVEIEMEK